MSTTQSRLLGMRHMTHFCIMTPLHHLNFGLVGGGMLHKDMFDELICERALVSGDDSAFV